MAKPDEKTEVEVIGPNVAGAVAKADELNALTSYDEVMAFLGIESEADFGQLEWETNPYQPVDKDRLVGIPHLIVQWNFADGTHGEFVIVRAVARLENGTDWFVLYVDGGHGVYQQLKELTEKRLNDKHPRPQQGARVLGGLTRSEYETEIEGRKVNGVTFYLSDQRKAA